MTNKTFTTLDALPVPTGPHLVGTVKFDLKDIYRKDLEFPSGRLIPIQIYFPREKGDHSLFEKIFDERVAIEPFQPLKVRVYSQQIDLSHLVGNEHPVILLNHASSVSMTDYAFLAEDLSSHG